MQVKHHMKKLIRFPSKFPAWEFLEGSKICVAVTQILKCFRTNDSRKWRNRFKICCLGRILWTADSLQQI